MSFRVIVQVQEEHLNKAIEEFSPILVKFGEIHKLPFEGSYLLDCEVSTNPKLTEALIRLYSRGIAFNAYSPNYKWSIRFNHLGVREDSFLIGMGDIALNTYELLRSRLWPDGCNKETAELRAYCVSMRFAWEDQAKHGRRYAMLNLLGK